MHTKEKPFTCEICSKAFSNSSSFKKHHHVYTKEKPFSCETYSKVFSESGNLKRDRRVHSE